MIISKDLFIFGEQIFATIIPEIGTPNSGNSSTATTTPPATPTTPILPVAPTHEHEEYFQPQHQHHQQQSHIEQQQIQQQRQIQAIKSNAIAENALKIAAKATATTTTTTAIITTEVGAAEQVCIDSTGKIKTITKIIKIPTATSISSLNPASAPATQAPASAASTAITTTTTKNSRAQQKEETRSSSSKPPTEAAATLKKTKFPKNSKEIIKLDKGKRESEHQNQQQTQQQQQQQQLELQNHRLQDAEELSGGGGGGGGGIEDRLEKQNKLLLSGFQCTFEERQKQNLEFNSHLEEDEHCTVAVEKDFDIDVNVNVEVEEEVEVGEEEEDEVEKRPLVKRDPIKIINAVTLPATTKRAQGETDDESLCLLLGNEKREVNVKPHCHHNHNHHHHHHHQQQQQLQQQQQHNDQHQEDLNQHQELQQKQTQNRQQTECRLQLEEELEEESAEQLLSSSKTTATTTTTINITSVDKACLSSTSSTAMGKVILANKNSSSGGGGGGNNSTTTSNDHAMVAFPFITDHQRTLQLTFQNITVMHNDRKILSDVSGLVSPGEVLAIMGPSGCGKTTLLDCLSGQRRIDSGSIHLNRETLSKKWRRKICYVLQEEVFFSGLTLRETVMYTALLRLPEKMPNAEKVKLVDRILQTLELNCCQQTKFGDYLNRGLSGGEKKRANIACELLTNPLLMLLDEPTSGLDSHSAISLMKVLKRYAIQEQKTVVITVHQPSSQMFHMFDKLLLLYNGRTAYFGEVNNIYRYFEDIGVAIKPHYNPADFVLEQLKSYPDIREKLFVAAKESHGNFINRNCITYSTKNHQHHHHQHHHQHHSQHTSPINQQTPNNHHNQQQQQQSNGHITTSAHQVPISASNGNNNNNKNQQRDALINNIINNYYKDISNNHHHHHVKHNNHNNHHLHHRHNHESPPLLIMGEDAESDSHHDSCCEDAAQQLWCSTADTQSNFSSSSSSSDYHQYETDSDWLDYPTRFHTQFRVLLSRNYKEAKPLMLSKLNWFQTIGLALMAGAIWFQLPRTEDYLHDLQGWMFFSQTYWMLFALFGALNSFPAEREVISKERRSGAYRLSAYYLAKMFGELPLVVTLPTVYLIISYPMLGCASLKLFFLMLVFLLLNTIVAQSVGFFIGACCMDMNVSITLSALYTLATQLFGGYLSSRIPEGLSWIRYTSMIHYAYQNMQILEFREGPAISCSNPSSFEVCKSNSTSVIPYEEILKAQNSTSPLWLNTLVLMMFFLVFRVLGYAVLRYIRCPKT